MSPPFDPNIPVLTEVLQGALPGPDGRDAEPWAALERRIAARILQQLQARIDAVLADAVQHALADLSAEICKGLQLSVEKIAAQAVSEERLQRQ